MIFELETAIKNKLETITRFVVVYDHFTLESEGYPFAAFEMSNFDGDFLDTCSNQRQFTFNIVVLHETSDKTTRDEAKNIIYKCLEDIITAFDGEQDLGEGSIVKGNVTRGEMGTFLDTEGSVLALNIELTLEIVTAAG